MWRLRAVGLLTLVCCCMAVPRALAVSLPLSEGDPRQRDLYREAMDAASRGDWRHFESLETQLEDYPLAPYLAYERLLARRDRLPGTAARTFVDTWEDSPLGLRFLGHYLRSAGERRRWSDYLATAETEPRSEALRCYFHRAQLAGGRRDTAWEGAASLWLSGRSVDDACDPLFDAWRRDGQLSEALLWERAGLAFGARQGSLLRYLGSLASPALAADIEVLRRVYREPQRTLTLAEQVRAAYRADAQALGLDRLSRYDPARALTLYQQLDASALDADQRAALEAAIALRGLIERIDGVRDWVDANLPRWQDDSLTEQRLRWAIAELDWQAVLSASAALSPARAATPDWAYWRARALEDTGDRAAAAELWASVADERSYYGFLSADRLGLPYSFNHRPPLLDDDRVTLPAPALATALRVQELQLLEEAVLAHAEWSHRLPRVDRAAQQAMAQLAVERGWYRFAIDAANESRSWDALDLRFPLAYTDTFRERAARLSLPLSELMAIARRESAFFPEARSPVGARGLMQLLPGTARATARREGISVRTSQLYEVEPNVHLGSAYYRQLLERFDGNRAVALAAYNAGPNRVQHWIGKGLPIDAWIETIPYRETRDYVKAVLAYSVVFDHRLGEEAQLLSAAERQRAY